MTPAADLHDVEIDGYGRVVVRPIPRAEMLRIQKLAWSLTGDEPTEAKLSAFPAREQIEAREDAQLIAHGLHWPRLTAEQLEAEFTERPAALLAILAAIREASWPRDRSRV